MSSGRSISAFPALTSADAIHRPGGIAGALVEPGNRLIRGVVAVISLVAGMIVIAQPGLSLVTLVWFSGVWMIVAGVVMVASALFGRRRAVATI